MPTTVGARLRSPEVARRLGIPGAEVYRLIFAGELDGRPDADGIVSVDQASVTEYLRGHRPGPLAPDPHSIS